MRDTNKFHYVLSPSDVKYGLKCGLKSFYTFIYQQTLRGLCHALSLKDKSSRVYLKVLKYWKIWFLVLSSYTIISDSICKYNSNMRQAGIVIYNTQLPVSWENRSLNIIISLVSLVPKVKNILGLII